MNWTELLTQIKEKQQEIMKLDMELTTKKEQYKMFTKEHLGLADGEQANILDVALAVRKIQAIKE